MRDALGMGDGMVRCGKGGLERSWSGGLVQGDYWVKQMGFFRRTRDESGSGLGGIWERQGGLAASECMMGE